MPARATAFCPVPALERLDRRAASRSWPCSIPFPLPIGDAELAEARIKYLTVAPMFAEAIERTYQEISIAKLFN